MIQPTLSLALVALLLPAAKAQSCLSADGFEPDDTCQSATLFGGNMCQSGLSITQTNKDWFGFTVAPGETLNAGIRAFDSAAVMGIRLYDGCNGPIVANQNALGTGAQLEWENTTANTKAVRLEVVQFGSVSPVCTFYDISVSVLESTFACHSDSFEPNNCCDIAADLPPGLHNLTLQAGDDDWFKVSLPPTSILEAHAVGIQPVDLLVWEDCFATFVASGVDYVNIVNVDTSPKTYFLRARAGGSGTGCYPYTLRVEPYVPGQQFCSGDGNGCVTCPCGNDAPLALRGCLNGAGTGARLTSSGASSVSNPTVAFNLADANPMSFAILTSGDSVAPGNPTNPCYGTNSGVRSLFLDGLRCAIGGVQRHGGRMCDVNGDIGVTNNHWGPPNAPALGLIAQGGFVAGQSRIWQVIYREDPILACGTGLNTSQGLLRIVLP